ncbi:MAG: CinA family protein, partial [Deltaproteobacteria bacterium]|nr:CinA family protein [Deltaproteobacteria bacterium]
GQELIGAEAAQGLAQGVREISGADLGLALTGRAARGKEEDHLIHIALAHPQGTEGIEQRWPYAMRFIENRVTKMALSQVRKHILDRNQK